MFLGFLGAPTQRGEVNQLLFVLIDPRGRVLQGHRAGNPEPLGVLTAQLGDGG